MLIIGLLTAFVAVGIDISIEQLAGWKYQIIKHRIFFKRKLFLIINPIEI